jgi:aspartate/methionine/tyrosine aminotransferase
VTGLEGFSPPPYPYDRLSQVAAIAERHHGGAIDLSIGTPCDAPPQAVVDRLSSSGTERGYPSSVGSGALRSAAAGWMARRFGLDVDPEHIAACVGTKEFVASAAWFLHLRTPRRDTVIVPAVAYPTYAMGAVLAGCRVVAVEPGQNGATDLASVSDADAGRAVCAWVNSPANPSGALSDLAAAAQWGRAHDVPVLSDECYAEFTWEGKPTTIIGSGTDGVVAVHSLSKRSNLAGVRLGCFAGDPDLVGYLAEVRKHAGLMVPGPVQAAGAVAWDDDTHVEVQRDRYRQRLELLAEAFGAVGLDAAMPAGAFYLWVPAPHWALEEAAGAPGRAAWVLAEALAEVAGVIVSPGEFYGESAGDFVRVAAVQPLERLRLVADRLASSSHPHLAPGVGVPGARSHDR